LALRGKKYSDLCWALSTTQQVPKNGIDFLYDRAKKASKHVAVDETFSNILSQLTILSAFFWRVFLYSESKITQTSL
jgi:hypothetical protein